MSQTTLGLPRFCPRWCHGAHAQALEELAGDVAGASVHVGDDMVGYTADGHGWQLQLVAGWQVLPPAREARSSVVLLAVHKTGGPYDHHQMMLTSGEARVLAAQLLNLADQEDLG